MKPKPTCLIFHWSELVLSNEYWFVQYKQIFFGEEPTSAIYSGQKFRSVSRCLIHFYQNILRPWIVPMHMRMGKSTKLLFTIVKVHKTVVCYNKSIKLLFSTENPQLLLSKLYGKKINFEWKIRPFLSFSESGFRTFCPYFRIKCVKIRYFRALKTEIFRVRRTTKHFPIFGWPLITNLDTPLLQRRSICLLLLHVQPKYIKLVYYSQNPQNRFLLLPKSTKLLFITVKMYKNVVYYSQNPQNCCLLQSKLQNCCLRQQKYSPKSTIHDKIQLF